MQGTEKQDSLGLRSFILHLALLLGLALFMFPFYWMIVSSLQPKEGIFVLPPRWWVTNPVWSNYREVFEATNFITGFLNSTFITLTKTVLILLFSAMGGFAF